MKIKDVSEPSIKKERAIIKVRLSGLLYNWPRRMHFSIAVSCRFKGVLPTGTGLRLDVLPKTLHALLLVEASLRRYLREALYRFSDSFIHSISKFT